jgi:hypothetical protein
MKYPKDQFLLPFRVDLIREERRRLVEIPDRTTAEYDLEKLKRKTKIQDAKITKRGKTYKLWLPGRSRSSLNARLAASNVRNFGNCGANFPTLSATPA